MALNPVVSKLDMLLELKYAKLLNPTCFKRQVTDQLRSNTGIKLHLRYIKHQFS